MTSSGGLFRVLVHMFDQECMKLGYSVSLEDLRCASVDMVEICKLKYGKYELIEFFL